MAQKTVVSDLSTYRLRMEHSFGKSQHEAVVVNFRWALSSVILNFLLVDGEIFRVDFYSILRAIGRMFPFLQNIF